MYPSATAANVAADIGAPIRTVENWLNGPSVPSLRWLGRIISVYGPEFLAEVMVNPPEWLIAAKRAALRERLEREIQELEQEIARAAL
jgi:hypothetical protein